VRSEWRLITTTHNLLKLHKHQTAANRRRDRCVSSARPDDLGASPSCAADLSIRRRRMLTLDSLGANTASVAPWLISERTSSAEPANAYHAAPCGHAPSARTCPHALGSGPLCATASTHCDSASASPRRRDFGRGRDSGSRGAGPLNESQARPTCSVREMPVEPLWYMPLFMVLFMHMFTQGDASGQRRSRSS
jgi:hypothetical protein